MGGRGGASKLAASPAAFQMQVQPPTIVAQAQQAQQASATLAQISSMSDDQLAQLATAAKTVDMPNFLNDGNDITQKFVYQAGLNGAPQVLDQAAFDAFRQQNNIPRSQIMSRSVNSNPPYSAQQIVDTFKYSELNYVGGKHGGQVSGAGTYFDMNGGGGTGYGNGATINAVLNPATARVINVNTLARQAVAFARSHPKFAAAVGMPRQNFSSGNYSTYALAMGYNVITNGGSYYSVIDRSAVVVLK